MANFTQSLQLILKHEGGSVNDPQDPGGETYKGIARKMNPTWVGWKIIDTLRKQKGFPKNLRNNADLAADIEILDKTNYWNKIKGYDLQDQDISNSIFDFAVNASFGTSSKLAHGVVKVKQDGAIGKETLKAINSQEPEKFLTIYTVAKSLVI